MGFSEYFIYSYTESRQLSTVTVIIERTSTCTGSSFSMSTTSPERRQTSALLDLHDDNVRSTDKYLSRFQTYRTVLLNHRPWAIAFRQYPFHSEFISKIFYQLSLYYPMGLVPSSRILSGYGSTVASYAYPFFTLLKMKWTSVRFFTRSRARVGSANA